MRGINPSLAMLRLLRARRGSSANSHLANMPGGRASSGRSILSGPVVSLMPSPGFSGLSAWPARRWSAASTRSAAVFRHDGAPDSTASDPVHRKSIAGAVVLT